MKTDPGEAAQVLTVVMMMVTWLMVMMDIDSNGDDVDKFYDDMIEVMMMLIIMILCLG